LLIFLPEIGMLKINFRGRQWQPLHALTANAYNQGKKKEINFGFKF